MDLNINSSVLIEKAWLARIRRLMYSVSYSINTKNIVLSNSFFQNFLWNRPEILNSYSIFPGWKEWMFLCKEGWEMLVLLGRIWGGLLGFFPFFFSLSGIYYYNNLGIPNPLPWRNSDDYTVIQRDFYNCSQFSFGPVYDYAILKRIMIKTLKKKWWNTIISTYLDTEMSNEISAMFKNGCLSKWSELAILFYNIWHI